MITVQKAMGARQRRRAAYIGVASNLVSGANLIMSLEQKLLQHINT